MKDQMRPNKIKTTPVILLLVLMPRMHTETIIKAYLEAINKKKAATIKIAAIPQQRES